MSPPAASSSPELGGRTSGTAGRPQTRSRLLPARATALLRGAAAAAVLFLLWQIRPAVPRLPSSLDTPMTAATLTDIATGAVWVLLASAAVLVLVRALQDIRRGPPVGPLPVVTAGRPQADRAAGATPAPARVSDYILTISRRPDSPPAVEHAAATEARPALDASAAMVPRDGRAISFLVLGPVAIEGTNRPRRAATRELLAYLALRPDGATRDQLVEALWPAQDPRRTRPRFWQSVSEARRLLGDAFIRDGDHYRLDRDRIRIDTDELAALLATANQAEDPVEERRLLECALDLWRGEPLEGSDWLWADGDLPAMRAALVELLERVAHLRLEAGDVRGALEAAERGLAVDELNEGLWRLALEAESALGLREAVAERYERLCRALDERLGLEPDRETRALHRRLLAQD